MCHIIIVSENLKTQITYPKNPILKKIVQYFIFIKKEDTSFVSQFCYPNTNHCLSLMKKSHIVKKNDSIYEIISSEDNNNYLTGIYKKPIIIASEIPYQELCINFNPLGLECVFGINMSFFSFNNNTLDIVDPSIKKTLYEIVFSNNSIEEVQNEIESFFLQLIKEEININHVHKINTIQHSTSIEEIEDLLCKSYRTIHRYFNNNLDINPKEFVLMKKVRTAMILLLENKSISNVAYDLDFTDTSHFIKTFKKYTNQTPTEFRNKASILNNTLIWNLE